MDKVQFEISKSFVLRSAFIVFLLSLTFAMSAPLPAYGQSFATLYNFTGGSNDGGNPIGRLTIDTLGNIIGTTSSGGSEFECGTVWKFNQVGKGTFSLVHSFHYSDGCYPFDGVTIYGNKMFVTTSNAGFNGFGTVWINKGSGDFYDFGNYFGDAEYPYGEVTIDSLGNLYGASSSGGAYTLGAIWKLTSTGAESVLYDFTFDGGNLPSYGKLLRDSAGNLYGLTTTSSPGCGGLYELTTNLTYRVLHTFNCAGDGRSPSGNIVEYYGVLYGTANGALDGSGTGNGTVGRYILNTKTFSVLHRFNGKDGSNPMGGLACMPTAKGGCTAQFYGAEVSGGAHGDGTLWMITSAGNFGLLHSFKGSDGANPYSSPLR